MLDLDSGSFRAGWLVPLAFGLALVLSGCGNERDEAQSRLLTAILDAEDARGGGPTGLGPLLEGLGATDPLVQRIAVRAVGRLEKPEHLGPISELLASPSPEVRAEAVNALGQSVFATAGDTVATLLHAHLAKEDDPLVRGVIGRTLGRLRYEDPNHVEEAERVLLALTLDGAADASVPSLMGAVMGWEWLARRNRGLRLSEPSIERLQTLTSFGLPSTSLEPEEAARVRRVAFMTLTATGGAGQDVLERALEDPDPDMRRLGLLAVGRSPDFPGQLEAIDRALMDSIPRVRAQAVAAFNAKAPEDQVCAGLIEATADDHAQVAIAALDLLRRPCPNTARQVQALMEFVEGPDAASSSRWHRGAHALLSLAGASPETVAPLLEEVVDHVSPFARVYVARAAAMVENESVLETLSMDQDPNVRAAAVQAIFRMKGHDADPVLLSQLGQDDPQLLLTVAGMLEGTPDPGAVVPPLLQALQRASGEGRETARDPRMGILERLAEVGGAESAAELEVYLTDFDPMVAERVAEILSDWTGTAIQASPQPPTRSPVPSWEELDRLALSRVVLEIEGGGEIQIALLAHLAPTTAARFARLARSGFLDGLTFHRVVSNFVVQGGSPGANEMSGDAAYTRDEIGLQSNWRGTVGASTRGRDTGDGQIFINVVDNLRLDHNYTILGEVVSGMDVVDRLVEGQVILRARVVDPS